MSQSGVVANSETLPVALYSTLMRIRPAQLGDLAKRALRIHSICLATRTGHTFFIDPVSVFGLDLLRDKMYAGKRSPRAAEYPVTSNDG